MLVLLQYHTEMSTYSIEGSDETIKGNNTADSFHFNLCFWSIGSTMFGKFYLVFILLSVGDNVFIRPKSREAPYVGRVKKITRGKRKNDDPKVTLCWYYKRDEIKICNKSFVAENELFYSSHEDVQSVKTIMGKCVVHTMQDYCKLLVAEPLDFYCRYNYDPLSNIISVGGDPNTDIVAVSFF
jgi:hypothetical protein